MINGIEELKGINGIGGEARWEIFLGWFKF